MTARTGSPSCRRSYSETDFDERWSFVDLNDRYHGLSRNRMQEVFATADVFVELDGSRWEVETAKNEDSRAHRGRLRGFK
jgi:hypothetical protein